MECVGADEKRVLFVGTGMAFFGVVESNSGLFGCRVDQFDTQWFYSDTKGEPNPLPAKVT